MLLIVQKMLLEIHTLIKWVTLVLDEYSNLKFRTTKIESHKLNLIRQEKRNDMSMPRIDPKTVSLVRPSWFL